MSRAVPEGTAVILLGHGSRAAGAAGTLAGVAARLAEKLGCPVAPASLQFNQPNLEEACYRFFEEGFRHIVVAPYFLFRGNHMKLDIPEEIDRIAAALPGAELLLTNPLGSDDRLVEVMEARVGEAIGQLGASAADLRIGTHPIESQSFDIIDEILQPDDAAAPEYQVIRRVVHASGDPALAGQVIFSRGAVAAALGALRRLAGNGQSRDGEPGGGGQPHIICDVRMVAAGIEPTAARMGIEVSCAVDGAATMALAKRDGITRGAAGIRRAAIDGAVVAIGNAPTALFECLRLAAEEDAKPALVVGVPVGFVGAAESKDALAASGLEFITIPGNRGGSNLAAAIANALMRLSAVQPKISIPAEKADSGPEGPSVETREPGGPHAHS